MTHIPSGPLHPEDRAPAPRSGERSPRLRPEERRSQILRAARRVLEADPHRELTVELAAAEAGVSPALLFHYFGSKKKFQYAVIEEAAAEVMLRTAPDLSLPPAEQLRSGIRAFVRAVLEAPQLYRATLLMSAAGDPAVRALHSELRQVFRGWVIAGVAGIRRADPPRLDRQPDDHPAATGTPLRTVARGNPQHHGLAKASCPHVTSQA
jgi:AcrR family transcriptional regulator